MLIITIVITIVIIIVIIIVVVVMMMMIMTIINNIDIRFQHAELGTCGTSLHGVNALFNLKTSTFSSRSVIAALESKLRSPLQNMHFEAAFEHRLGRQSTADASLHDRRLQDACTSSHASMQN